MDYHLSKDSLDLFFNSLANGEFRNYYQPQVDSTSMCVVGYEALSRWLHPSLGVLSPHLYMPLVEKFELFDVLFEAVLGSLVMDIETYNSDADFSLNLDLKNLENSKVADRLYYACTDAGINTGKITIEITEKSPYKISIEEVVRNLIRIKDYGFRISMDDFGTGYSSLELLYYIPIHEIKIDRFFVKGVSRNSKKKVIIENIVELAEKMEISVVAEGIESHSDLEVLKLLDIDRFQGYYFGRPSPKLKNKFSFLYR